RYQGVIRRRAESVVPLALALLPLTVPLLLLGLALLPVWRPGLAVSALAAGLVAGFGATMAAVVRPDRREPSPVAFRLLVGFLYAAQPLVPTWAPLQARPRPPPPSARVWSGDRIAWLAEAERQLSRWGCACRRARADATFDLEVSLVGLAVCRVTTAVVWGWLPRFRTRVWPGRLTLPVLAVGAVIGLARPPVGAAVLAGAGALTAFEAGLLTRLVRRVLVRTSREAGWRRLRSLTPGGHRRECAAAATSGCFAYCLLRSAITGRASWLRWSSTWPRRRSPCWHRCLSRSPSTAWSGTNSYPPS